MMRGRLNLLYLAGVLVIALGFLVGPSTGWAAYRDYLGSITTGSLNQPAKVAVGSNAEVYVSVPGANKVNRYSSAGVYQSSIAMTGKPVGIAVTDTHLFVGDDTENCVWIYDRATEAVADLAATGTTHKLGSGSTTIRMPNTITIAPSGHIFVVDGDSDKIYIFNSNGSLNSSFGVSNSTTSSGTTINCYYPTGLVMSGSSGQGTGTITQNFFLGDQGNYRVQKLSYQYNETTQAITTPPTFIQNVGTTPGVRGDGFGAFIRISDLAWINNSTLVVIDSLQMVGQMFNSSGNTLNTAFNYTTSVQGYLNIPTGAAFDPAGKKLYVTSNQGNSIVTFSTQDGNPPTVNALNPNTAETPCTATYTVNFSGTDSDSSSVTVNSYYIDGGNPVLFDTQTVAVTAQAFSGSAVMDLVGTFPNYVAPGTYGIRVDVVDEKFNTASSTATGTVGITAVDGAYTCSMEALWGASTADFDLDSVANGAEINGTFNSTYSNAKTNPADSDTDNDGLDDGVEMAQKNVETNIIVPMTGAFTVTTNPNSVDTDTGGVSDAVEIVKGTSPSSGGDDLVVASSPQDIVSDFFMDHADFAGGPHMQCSTVSFGNISTATTVIDLAIYNANGTLNKTVPAAYTLNEGQCVRFDPFDTYGISEGSIEVRATSAAIRGDIVRFRENYQDHGNNDLGDVSNMGLQSDRSTHKYSSLQMDSTSASLRYRTDLYVKNWEDTPANITVNFYKYNDGSPESFPFVVGGHETLKIKTGDLTSFIAGGMEVTSDTPVTAYEFIQRWSSFDASTWDFAFIYNMQNEAYTTSYAPFWIESNSASLRYIDYVYIYNPSDTATINVTVQLYDYVTGSPAGSKNIDVGPHVMSYFKPSSTGTSSIAGSYKVTSTGGPHIATNMVERYSATMGSSQLDWGYFLKTVPTGMTMQYCSHYREYPLPTEPTQRYRTYLYMAGTDDVTGLDVDITYYNPDGTVNKTVNKTAVPHKLLFILPSTNDGAPAEGMFSVKSNNGVPVTAFTMGQFWNKDYSTNTIIDFGFAKPTWVR